MNGSTAPPEIRCERCKHALPLNTTAHQRLVCEQCEGVTEVWLFPAYFSEDSNAMHRPELAVDDAARCFYHEAHQAERVCDSCGRFLCGLCAIEWGAYHLCTNCIESQHLPDDAIISGRTLQRYDVIALYLMVACWLLWFISFLIYPIALYFLYLAYTRPVSLVERWSWARIGATIFAIVYVVVGGFVIVAMMGY